MNKTSTLILIYLAISNFSMGQLTENLPGSPTATLLRGPYLQIGTSGSIIIRWRSDVATDTKVNYGTLVHNLETSVSSANLVTDHEIKIEGLDADTKYYYSVGSSTQVLQADTNNFFITAPEIGSAKKTRIWVSGDCGSNSIIQKNGLEQYISYVGANYTDIWMLLGDNAYANGLDHEYQESFFDVYKDKILKQTVVWPAPGNHEYANHPARQKDHDIPYYNLFTLPANGEAGGVASGTEAYYSYNYSNIHFVSLDSYGKESDDRRLYDTLGAQVKWLKEDLAHNKQKWTIVYFHHPPYSMGSHNSDRELELIKIRQNLIEILERYKVDLVICGHSHVYERSKLLKGYYGSESTFQAAKHQQSSSNGLYDGSANSCPYVKDSESDYNGAVYVVTGSAGKLGSTQASWPHNAMYFSDAAHGGTMAIEVEENRLDAKWICADGVVRDKFTILKDVNKITSISIQQGQIVTLKASWPGAYSWASAGASKRTIAVSPASSTSYYVKDTHNCITDVFKITVHPASAKLLIEADDQKEIGLLKMEIFPNPVENMATVKYTLPYTGNLSLSAFDERGKEISLIKEEKSDKGSYILYFSPASEKMGPGLYLFRLKVGEKEVVEKVMVGK